MQSLRALEKKNDLENILFFIHNDDCNNYETPYTIFCLVIMVII
jgi:hypothetical protein